MIKFYSMFKEDTLKLLSMSIILIFNYIDIIIKVDIYIWIIMNEYKKNNELYIIIIYWKITILKNV